MNCFRELCKAVVVGINMITTPYKTTNKASSVGTTNCCKMITPKKVIFELRLKVTALLEYFDFHKVFNACSHIHF